MLRYGLSSALRVRRVAWSCPAGRRYQKEVALRVAVSSPTTNFSTSPVERGPGAYREILEAADDEFDDAYDDLGASTNTDSESAALDPFALLAEAPEDPAGTVAAVGERFPVDSISGPITALQHCFEVIHTSTGLPWWVTFAASSVVLRVALFPTTVFALRNSNRLSKAGPDLQRVNQAYVEASQALGATANFSVRTQKMREYFRALKLVYKKHRAHPVKNFIPFLAHFPVFLTCIYSIRGMINQEPDVFTQGGALWFTDLSVQDPYYALPITAVSLTLLNLERMKSGLSAGLKVGQAMPLMPKMLIGLGTGFQYMLLLGCYFTAQLPAGFFFFWISSGLWQLGYSSAIQNPKVKALLSGESSNQQPTQVSSRKTSPPATKEGPPSPPR